MVKRIFDITFSLIFLILLSPVFLVAAILVKLNSKGEIIYKQKRLGKDGNLFTMYKFRTMIAGADRMSRITGKNDSRITKTGKILRKTKLDELPQLVNVLKGDMSIVGPRPEVEDFKEFYTGKYKKILGIKPGITDYASVYYIEEEKILPENDKDSFYKEKILPEKLDIQLEYVDKRNFFYDISIIFKTIKSLFIKGKKKNFIDGN